VSIGAGVKNDCVCAVAVAIEVHEAGRRHTLGVLDEAVEGASHRHQADLIGGMNVDNGAGQVAVLDGADGL